MPHSFSSRTRSSLQLLALRRQAGMSMFGWLVLFCVLAFCGNIAMKVVPHYLDHNAVIGVIEGISPEVWRGNLKKNMHAAVNKGLKVNSIRSLKSNDVLKIERSQALTKVLVDYEVRESLFGNIDVVLVFKKDYQF